MTLGAVAVAAYALALVWIAWRGRAAAASSDMFNIFGRNAGSLRATAGYLSLIGAGELVTISQLGYDAGLSLLWFPGGIAAGFVLLGLLGDGVREKAKAIGTNTLVGYVTAVFGRAPGIALSIVFFVALGALLTIQFIVGGQLLQITTGLPADLTPILMAAIIVSYLLIGGYVSVLSTDVLRLIFLAVVVIALAFASWAAAGAGVLVQSTFPTLPFPDGLTLFVLGLFGAICAGDVWQTVLASKSKLVLRNSMFLAAACFLAFGALIGVLGMAAKLAVPVLPEGTSALIAATQSVIPSAMVPLMALMIAGSVIATADTEIWVLSTSIVSLNKPAPVDQEKRDAFQNSTRWRVRLAIPIITAIALTLSYLTKDAKAVYEGLLILLTAIAPAMLAILFNVRRPVAVALSLWTALACYAALAAWFRMAIPASLTFAPVFASFIALIVGMMIDEAQGRKTAN